ncbi:uncharacterized protein ColSpa_09238 [Colletotrichum spaethianum]|uniref:Uncharacterized protein n=1 Tax=Colletotrichum spaethianum TaxID=700344 RepID=A0AA37PBA3_9PEZI|nr:uncharacterized protein ColSpa_09238 [Colletotrichum spaethianum]GKT49057.1 hypothetical protein ColSpa_09238 [Colletotrichum spaethianum]
MRDKLDAEIRDKIHAFCSTEKGVMNELDEFSTLCDMQYFQDVMDAAAQAIKEMITKEGEDRSFEPEFLSRKPHFKEALSRITCLIQTAYNSSLIMCPTHTFQLMD